MNDESRNKTGYDVELSSFRDTIILHCPNCNRSSILRNKIRNGFLEGVIICNDCGYNKQIKENDYILYADELEIIESKISFEHTKSNFLKLKLWYTKKFKDNVFWVYNLDHLNFIEEFITSKLRERDNVNIKNKSIGSRLPRWMTSSKNRTDMLKLIADLNKTTANSA